MPDYQCIQCTTCLAFQARQVSKQAKAPRWSCAKCGTKQPLGRVYAISASAKDIRLHVQKLSNLQAEQGNHLNSFEQPTSMDARGTGAVEEDAWADHGDADEAQQAQHVESRWNKYVDKVEPEDDEAQAERRSAEPGMPAYPQPGQQVGGNRKRQMESTSDCGRQASTARPRTADPAAGHLLHASIMQGGTSYGIGSNHRQLMQQAPQLWGQSSNGSGQLASTATAPTIAAQQATTFQSSNQGSYGGGPTRTMPTSHVVPEPGSHSGHGQLHSSWQPAHHSAQPPPSVNNNLHRQPLQPLNHPPQLPTVTKSLQQNHKQAAQATAAAGTWGGHSKATGPSTQAWGPTKWMQYVDDQQEDLDEEEAGLM